MKFRSLTKTLYEISEYLKKVPRSVKESFKSKKVLKWLFGGMSIHATSAAYKFILGSKGFLPANESFYIGSIYFPSGMTESLVVNVFARGAIGAVFGEKFFESLLEKKLSGLKKYFARLTGSFASVTAWIALQYAGYVLSEKYSIVSLYGKNPFEGPDVCPSNYLIALLISPLVPYAAEYLYSNLKRKH